MNQNWFYWILYLNVQTLTIYLHVNPPRLSFSAVLTHSQSYRSCSKVPWCAGPILYSACPAMKSGTHLGPLKHNPTRERDKFRISLPLQPLGNIWSVLQEITDLTASGAACTRCSSLRRMPSEWRPSRIVSPKIWVSPVTAFQGLDPEVPEPYVFVFIHRCISLNKPKTPKRRDKLRGTFCHICVFQSQLWPFFFNGQFLNEWIFD